MRKSIRTFAVAVVACMASWLASPAAAHVALQATLTPDQETDAPSLSGHSPSGTATMFFDFETKTIQYEVIVSDLTSAQTAAHIHPGARGVAGPPLTCCTLASTLGGTTGALSDEQIQALFNQGLYVNVHTADNPAGEIRGQIELAAGACGCEDTTRRDFKRCVKSAVKGLDAEDRTSEEIKALKKAVKKSSCGRRKVSRKSIACCLPITPDANVVTDQLCAPVRERACTKIGGASRGVDSRCLPNPCSSSGAFLNDDGDLF